MRSDFSLKTHVQIIDLTICASFQTRPDMEAYRKSALMEEAENKSLSSVLSKFQALRLDSSFFV